jgi:hypothetical protein
MRGLQARQAWRDRVGLGAVMPVFLAGCLANPTPLRAPSDWDRLRLIAQVIAPETLLEVLDDAQAPEHIVAVQVRLHNVGAASYTATPSRTALVGR